MTTKTLLKKLLGVKDLVVESFRTETMPDGTLKLIIRVRPAIAKQCRCSQCHKRIPRYDRAVEFGLFANEIRKNCICHSWGENHSIFEHAWQLGISWIIPWSILTMGPIPLHPEMPKIGQKWGFYAIFRYQPGRGIIPLVKTAFTA